jgi:hypothetical protein
MIKVAKGLHAVGLINIPYAFADDTIYAQEANPGASRNSSLNVLQCLD